MIGCSVQFDSVALNAWCTSSFTLQVEANTMNVTQIGNLSYTATKTDAGNSTTVPYGTYMVGASPVRVPGIPTDLLGPDLGGNGATAFDRSTVWTAPGISITSPAPFAALSKLSVYYTAGSQPSMTANSSEIHLTSPFYWLPGLASNDAWMKGPSTQTFSPDDEVVHWLTTNPEVLSVFPDISRCTAFGCGGTPTVHVHVAEPTTTPCETEASSAVTALTRTSLVVPASVPVPVLPVQNQSETSLVPPQSMTTQSEVTTLPVQTQNETTVVPPQSIPAQSHVNILPVFTQRKFSSVTAQSPSTQSGSAVLPVHTQSETTLVPAQSIPVQTEPSQAAPMPVPEVVSNQIDSTTPVQSTQVPSQTSAPAGFSSQPSSTGGQPSPGTEENPGGLVASILGSIALSIAQQTSVNPPPASVLTTQGVPKASQTETPETFAIPGSIVPGGKSPETTNDVTETSPTPTVQTTTATPAVPNVQVLHSPNPPENEVNTASDTISSPPSNGEVGTFGENTTPAVSKTTSPPPIDSIRVTSLSTGGFVIASQTLRPSAAITAGGTTYSLASSGGPVVVNGQTTLTFAPNPTTSLLVGTLAVTTATSGGLIIAGQTLTQGSAITASGTTYSLASTGSAIIVNGQTTVTESPSPSPSVTIGSIAATPIPSHGFVLASQTLTVGGTVTASGTTYALPSSNVVVINGQTSTLASVGTWTSTGSAAPAAYTGAARSMSGYRSTWMTVVVVLAAWYVAA